MAYEVISSSACSNRRAVKSLGVNGIDHVSTANYTSLSGPRIFLRLPVMLPGGSCSHRTRDPLQRICDCSQGEELAGDAKSCGTYKPKDC
jgi:hypothetical protein